MNKLILIEGLFGSGKSTTAELLSKKLSSQGHDVVFHVEADLENPVGLIMSRDEADNTIKSTTLESYPYETWKNLKLKPNSSMILEARFIQNSSFWAMLNGESEDNCIELPRKILASIPRGLEVKLIVLEQSNPNKHISNVINERKVKHPYWLPHICDLFNKQAWSVNNKTNNLEGFVEAQLAWSKLFPKVYSKLDCDKLVITDPQANWTNATNQALKFSLGSI